MSDPDFAIEPMTEADAGAVLAIYAEGVATGNATFQTEIPTREEWHAAHFAAPRLVARQADGTVLGWCALSPVSRREVYAGVVEESVYVAAAARGRGVGKALLQAMVAESEHAGVWTMQAGIFPENAASIALHESCGFRVVGLRERIGQHFGQWRDVLLMERRSKLAGAHD